ncbi:hypothetical protein [Algibacter sp. L1A34]|uniref:hypothetical protein n=1 Tax=Algibacter sp. L1A34 TaxID=2686365 RepID=UPI00131E8E71|nr:hypothetical protein [Algibacter sp. L1A34]
MIEKIYYRLFYFIKIGYRFKLQNSTIKGSKNSTIKIGKNVKIINSYIDISAYSEIVIDDNTVIKNANISVKGSTKIGKGNFINNGGESSNVSIRIDGEFVLGNNNRIQSAILLRYNAKLNIGDYNNINKGSEIRSDESIRIGDYNQLSYNIIIWDTNTHNIYSAEVRRELAQKHYPVYGYEFEKPKTKPVIIGNDCWIGRNASLLKGTNISNKCIIGYQTCLSNCKIEENTTVITEISNKLISNNI